MIVLSKLPDWRERLKDYVVANSRQAFSWRDHDCARFADGAVVAQTGVSLMGDELKGAYGSLEEASKLLAGLGYADHVAWLADRLPEVPPAFAHVGDVAVVEVRHVGPVLTIVGGQHLVGVGLVSRSAVSRLQAVRAFAVGWQP
jgi:hypothetical protein